MRPLAPPSPRQRLSAAVPWLVLLASCAFALTALDVLLIRRTTDLFTGGFFVAGNRWTAFHFAAFFAASLVFDATLVLGLWLVALPVLRRSRLALRQEMAAAAIVALAPPLAVLYVRYQLSRFLGDLIDANLLLALAGGSPLEWLAQASAHLLPVVSAIAAGLVSALLVVRGLRAATSGSDYRLGEPRFRDFLALFAAGVAAAGVVLFVVRQRAVDYQAIGLKNSGLALTLLYENATDFDLDGFGMFARPVDPAPFDASIHPYALDVPGNGIDENGLGGDHPADYRAPRDDFREAPVFGARPNVLLIYLESMRGDVVGQKLGDRVIMPFVSKLAQDGASSEHAYANSPYTALSRTQLMGGRLVPYSGQTTLIDDFHRNGYQVAWFSGQDESFGIRESAALGQARADEHYDARDDVDRAVGLIHTSGSLQVSWKRVNEVVTQFLDTRKDPRPLFLYVNYGDTHFPYDHAQMDDVLGVPRLARADIQPERREELFATYANAAANVDRAIEQLVAHWRSLLGPDGAIIITSDHGEALFETGALGHGLSLDAAQTRVPLVLYGVGGTWPEPIGASDVRGALQRALQVDLGPAPRPRFVPVPGRRILQYMALIERPRLLCLRGLDSETRFDTAYGIPRHDPDFEQMIWWWESAQLAWASGAP